MLRWIHQIRIYFKILLNETENRQSDLKIQIRIALKERTRDVIHYYKDKRSYNALKEDRFARADRLCT
jgi:hypothetical protein